MIRCLIHVIVTAGLMLETAISGGISSIALTFLD
jgi:hypothetical protein